MSIAIYALDIAGSEWFIILLTIIIIFVPSKITGISKTIGRFIGEYEKTKNSLLNEKNNLLQQQKSIDDLSYKGPYVQRPVSSDREKLEMIAKSLNLDIENKSDDELRNLISSNLK
jgi:sec-independent protein translocase protein TatA